jgi:hypothetical protein
MTQSPDLPIPAAANLPAGLDHLGPAAFIPGESASGYDTLLARVSGAVKPADILEEIWTREVVDHVWEALRHRRLKASLMTACAGDGMKKVLASLGVSDVIGLAQRWFARDLATVARIDALLEAAGLGIDTVMAQTLRLHIAEIERIERLVAAAEAARNTALREIERHRAGFAATLRRAAQAAGAIEYAEFEVVAPPIARQPADAAA